MELHGVPLLVRYLYKRSCSYWKWVCIIVKIPVLKAWKSIMVVMLVLATWGPQRSNSEEEGLLLVVPVFPPHSHLYHTYFYTVLSLKLLYLVCLFCYYTSAENVWTVVALTFPGPYLAYCPTCLSPLVDRGGGPLRSYKIPSQEPMAIKVLIYVVVNSKLLLLTIFETVLAITMCFVYCYNFLQLSRSNDTLEKAAVN